MTILYDDQCKFCTQITFWAVGQNPKINAMGVRTIEAKELFLKIFKSVPKVICSTADTPTTELLLMLSEHRRPVVFGMFSMLMKKRTDIYGFRNQQHC